MQVATPGGFDPRPKHKKTSRKIIYVIERKMRTVGFISKCEKIRKKYGIDTNSYQEYRKFFIEDSLHFTSENYFPLPNGEWIDFIQDVLKVSREIERIVQLQFRLATVNYVLFDNLNLDFLDNPNNLIFKRDLFDVLDIPEEILIDSFNNSSEDFLLKPIAICIHPQAKKEDIIDFVNNHYPFIKQKLDTYSDNNSLINKIRDTGKKGLVRDEVIARTRNKSIKEISSELSAKGVFLEQGNIHNYKKKLSK